ncbi:UDP-glucosyltransferase 2-like isoform X2 [Planococcus citri]|uniref:UDP-glucosyltransferase 2-like isoform X2 n=1 Tax=Planococcus citri TaxID=170843 RepID=UPI0031F80892
MYLHLYIAIFFLIFFLNSNPVAESAKILGIFPTRSRSHHSINQPIVKGLASKGHQVTIISPFKSNDNIPNYREILITQTEELSDWVDGIAIEDTVNYVGARKLVKISAYVELSNCDKVLGLEYVKQLIHSKNNEIDLIMVEVFHVQCFHLLAYKLNVPLIIVQPLSNEMGADYFVGNPSVLSTTPVCVTAFTTKMNFWQRFENVFQYMVIYWYHHFGHNKDMAVYARKHFNMELPTDEELHRRTALVLNDNHPSFISRPKSPNAIDIAGIHIKEPKKLPKDVEEFIEGAAHGVIFFSFGTTIKASSISPEKMRAIKAAFSAIPQRVLWRVNDLNISDVPPNVKLEHKNVIAFISHCGLLGTLEAIHTATPVIGIPFAFDQFQNAKILVEREVGIEVDYFEMNKDTLIGAIKEITTNTKYQENIIRWSNIFKDRPTSALDEALYWTEYVLKHRGAPHLRTAAADMPFYQYFLLDVLGFVLLIVISFLYFTKLFFKCIISLVCRQKPKKNKTQ